jgi:hypothetical protein
LSHSRLRTAGKAGMSASQFLHLALVRFRAAIKDVSNVLMTASASARRNFQPDVTTSVGGRPSANPGSLSESLFVIGCGSAGMVVPVGARVATVRINPNELTLPWCQPSLKSV